MDADEARHFCKGPKMFDTLCGVEGYNMTALKRYVTCDDCLEKIERIENRGTSIEERKALLRGS